MEQKENTKFIYQMNNKAQSSNYFVLFIFSGVILLGLAFYFLIVNLTPLLIGTVVLAIAWFIVLGKVKPSYFEFLLTETQLQINHYSVATAARTYQSVELYLKDFEDFRIEKSFGGLKKVLVIGVKMKLGVADFPGVSVSILTKGEMAQVLAVLNKIKETKR